MNQDDIAELSADLIMRYYENEPMPFLQYMDENALWYGPAEGQFIKGRDAMIHAWSEEDHMLTFTVGNMTIETISSHPSFCNVMLSYPVVTHYPDGHDIAVDQRMLLSWGEKQITDEQGNKSKRPRILVCHISNPHERHDDDWIYPKRFDQIYSGRIVMKPKGERIHLQGIDRLDYFFLSDTICWIEASSGGKRSIVHSFRGAIEVRASVSKLAGCYPHLFLRCHQSFLVNPHYIRNISRFQVTMTNGTVLPIPEKKYTAFRDQVMKFLRD